MPEKLIPEGSKIEKLIPHLGNRNNYIVHEKTLKMYIDQGIILKKIHRCLEFKQKPWLKPYIDMNTKARTKSKTEFEKTFFKLMNNAVYGQTLMDVTRFVEFELVTCKDRYKTLLREPWLIKNEPWQFPCDNCKDPLNECGSCSENVNCVAAVEKVKKQVLLNRPIYLGFTILELSKYLMYDFWYNVLKKTYREKIKLLATDTDSFIFEIQCDDIVKEMAKYKNVFDFSNYGKKHPMYLEMNKKVPGKMKREYPGQIIVQFVGLLSKCYSLKLRENYVLEHMECEPTENVDIKVSKGVPSKKLSHEDYVKVLTHEQPMNVEMKSIRSKKQQIHVISQTKQGLSCDDDKRIWIGKDQNDPETYGNTLAHGHFKASEYQKQESTH